MTNEAQKKLTDQVEEPVADRAADEEQPDERVTQANAEEQVEATTGEESETPDEQILPLLPLRGTVVFPQTLVPLAAALPRSLRLIDDVMAGDRTVAMVLQ